MKFNREWTQMYAKWGLILSLFASIGVHSRLIADDVFFPTVTPSRKVLLTPLSLFPGTNANAVYDRAMYTSTTNGTLTVSNMTKGLWQCEIQAPPDRTAFAFFVPTNGTGGTLVWVNTILRAIPAEVTRPQEYAYSAQSSDARYFPITGSVVTNAQLAGYVPVTGVAMSGPMTNLTADLHNNTHFKLTTPFTSYDFHDNGTGTLILTNANGDFWDFLNGLRVGNTGSGQTIVLNNQNGKVTAASFQGSASNLSGPLPQINGGALTNTPTPFLGVRTNLVVALGWDSWTAPLSQAGISGWPDILQTNLLGIGQNLVCYSNFGVGGVNNLYASNQFASTVAVLASQLSATNLGIYVHLCGGNDSKGSGGVFTPDQSFFLASNCFYRAKSLGFFNIAFVIPPLYSVEPNDRYFWRGRYNTLLEGLTNVDAFLDPRWYINDPGNTNLLISDTHEQVLGQYFLARQLTRIIADYLTGHPQMPPMAAWDVNGLNAIVSNLTATHITIPTNASGSLLGMESFDGPNSFNTWQALTFNGNSSNNSNVWYLKLVTDGVLPSQKHWQWSFIGPPNFSPATNLADLYLNGNYQIAGSLFPTNGVIFPQGTNTAPSAAAIGGSAGVSTNFMLQNIGGVLSVYQSDGSTVIATQLAPPLPGLTTNLIDASGNLASYTGGLLTFYGSALSDPDASNYCALASITDGTTKFAINTLIVQHKAAGVWTNNCQALYPMAGAAITNAIYNARTNAFHLVNHSATYGSSGISFVAGSSTYLDTGFNPAVANIAGIAQNSIAFMVYIEVGNAMPNGSVLIGAFDNGSLRSYLSFSAGSGNLNVSGFGNNGTSLAIFTNTFNGDLRGPLVATRTGSTAQSMYFRGQTANDTAASTGVPSATIAIGCRGGTLDNFSTMTLAGAGIYGGLTSTQAAAVQAAWDKFNAILGRKVP